MSNYDFETLNSLLLQRAEQLCFEWLPGGRVSGHEYVCGSIHGGAGRSLSVNLQTGKWADFANKDVRGGDLISLYAATKGVSQGDAFRQLSDRQKGYNSQPTSNKKPVDDRLGPVPEGTKTPSFVHMKLGKPVSTYVYKDEHERVLFYISRYETVDGKKTYLPWSWSKQLNRFVHRQWPAPRPLYRLDMLAKNPTLPVLICEGEKAAAAAHVVLGEEYVCITWPAGTSSWDKTDWSPVYNRRILIWPDADTPGMRCATELGQFLARQCPSVKYIRHEDITETKGKDAHDFFDTAKNSAADFKTWSGPLIYDVPEAKLATRIEPDKVISEIPKPGNVLRKSNAQIYALAGVDKFIGPKSSVPPPNEFVVSQIIKVIPEMNNGFWYDEFYNAYYTDFRGKHRLIDDNVITEVTQYFQGYLGLTKLTTAVVKKVVIQHANSQVRNSARDWANSLKWDGEERINMFMSTCLGVEMTDEFIYAVSGNMWKCMAARMLWPGCKVDTMVVLEGPQGSFKSTALQIIGGDWYASLHFDPRNKDFIMAIQGRIIIEIPELSGFSRADVNSMKAMLSCSEDLIRKPYAATNEALKRTAMFVGTTNDATYLNDETGARRYWPVTVGEINLELIKQNREQLFAEAIHKVKNGEAWWDIPQELAEMHQRLRQDESDPWDFEALRFVAHLQRKHYGHLLNEPLTFSTKKFLDFLNVDIGKSKYSDSRRAGRALRSAGCKLSQRKTTGDRDRQRLWEYDGGDLTKVSFLD